MRALLLPLFTRSVWAQPATKLAGTTVDDTPFASVRLVGVDSDIHLGGGHDSRGSWSVLCSLGTPCLSLLLFWRA